MRLGGSATFSPDGIFVSASAIQIPGATKVRSIFFRCEHRSVRIPAKDCRTFRPSRCGFGVSMSVLNHRLIVGAAKAQNGGEAYVFHQDDNGSWTYAETVTNPNPTGDDGFGVDVEFMDASVIIGALNHGNFGNSGGLVYEKRFAQPICKSGGACVCLDGAEGSDCATLTSMGDGEVQAAEGCDDGNTVDGDGCSSQGQVEAFFVCNGEPSQCQVDCVGVANNTVVSTGTFGDCAYADACTENGTKSRVDLTCVDGVVTEVEVTSAEGCVQVLQAGCGGCTASSQCGDGLCIAGQCYPPRNIGGL